MKTINVDDLPEEAIRELEEHVATLRERPTRVRGTAPTDSRKGAHKKTFLPEPSLLGVRGSLTRKEIYEDAFCDRN